MRLLRYQPCVRATGATLHWSLDDPRELERSVPGVRLEAERSMLDVPEIARFPWPSRLIAAVLNRLPAARRMGRLMRYSFVRIT